MRPYLRSRGARVRQRPRNPTREHVQGLGGFKRLLVHGVELTKVGALDSKLLNKLVPEGLRVICDLAQEIQRWLQLGVMS